MADFRSHDEQKRDRLDADRQNRKQESEAQAALTRMETQITDYKTEVKALQDEVAKLHEDNQALTAALKVQMQGVEEIKGFLVERMDGLATDMDQVHKKILRVAEDDMRLVKQLSDNQNDRLAKLVNMVKGG